MPDERTPPSIPAIREALEPCAVGAMEVLLFHIGPTGAIAANDVSYVAALSQAASLKRIADALENVMDWSHDPQAIRTTNVR